MFSTGRVYKYFLFSGVKMGNICYGLPRRETVKPLTSSVLDIMFIDSSALREPVVFISLTSLIDSFIVLWFWFTGWPEAEHVRGIALLRWGANVGWLGGGVS